MVKVSALLTEGASPTGGTYSLNPYVRSFVWILPKSVVTSCRSVTQIRFVVCLYVVNAEDCPFASTYVPVNLLALHCSWTSASARSNCRWQSDRNESEPQNPANIASPALIIILARPHRLHEFREFLNATGDSFRLIYTGNL